MISRRFLFLLSIFGLWGLPPTAAQVVTWNGHLGDIDFLADGASASPALIYTAPAPFCGPCDAFCNNGQPALYGYSIADELFNTPAPPGMNNPPYVEAQAEALPGFEMNIIGLELYLWSYENAAGSQWGPRRVDIGWSTDGLSWNVSTHEVNTDNNDCQTQHTPANASFIQVPVNLSTTGPIFLRMQFYEANGTNDIGNFETDIFQVSITGDVCFAGNNADFEDLNAQVNDPLCPGDSLLLNATTANWPLNYNWKPGASAATPFQPTTWVAPETTTTYTLEVWDNCLFFYQDTVTVFVEELIPAAIEQDPLQGCEGDTVTLTALAGPGASWQWSTGSTAPQIRVSENGNYQLAVSSGNCTRTVAQVVDLQPYPIVDLPEADTICMGYPLALQALAGSAEYLWSTGQTGPLIEVSEPGFYTVAVTDKGCTTTAGVQVIADVCDCAFYFPNAFSPNFDGINDGFGPEYRCQSAELADYELLVFSRWGELLFRSTDPKQKWDGQTGGQPAPGNIFTYLASYTLELDGIRVRKQHAGDVSILR
jgi:gliding motility-associated-like protein